MTVNRTARGIVTPEAVVLEFDTAGAGSRVLAESLDVLIQLTLLATLLLAASIIAASGGVGQTIAIVLAFLFFFLVLIGYPVAMETLWNGRTLGKAALGLRVVTMEGGPIRFRHAAIRGMFGLVELWIFFGSLAVVAVVFSRRNQRIGDMAAGTLVLRERTAAAPSVAIMFPPPPGFESYAASLDVSTVDSDQYAIIRSFLMRVFQLSYDARVSLAVRIANPVALAMHHTPPPAISPETFLACVASAYQRRHGIAQATPSPQPWAAPPPPSAGGWSPPPPSGVAPGGWSAAAPP